MSGETTNTCRPAANAAPASMRAPQACSSSPLTNNNASQSRASSMHLTQCLDQASAVGSLPGKLPGQSIREYNFDTCSAGARAQDFSSYFCSCSQSQRPDVRPASYPPDLSPLCLPPHNFLSCALLPLNLSRSQRPIPLTVCGLGPRAPSVYCHIVQ